jgi:putative folate metabolism gamma-glutamate ligase
MQVKAIKTKIITHEDQIFNILDTYINNLEEKDILAISSKIISVMQGRIITKDLITKKDLVYQNADCVINCPQDADKLGLYLTIKNSRLIPSAGIDESNGQNSYILYPENLEKITYELWLYLKNKFNLKNFGVIVTDSNITPMRAGVTGICLSWCGFDPLYSYIGNKDIYGNKLQFTKINIIDALASSAVFIMGEGQEQIPFAIIKDAPKIEFQNSPPSSLQLESVSIKPEQDMFYEILKPFIRKL